MTRRLTVPLNAVRAFEAAARHASFNDAAAELHVTPSAISHQVRRLEVFLGVCLFRREGRGVKLTEAGHSLLPALESAFDQIDAALARVTRPRRDDRLTLAVSPTFASEWLVPRLLGFRRRHPDIEVRLVTEIGPPDFSRRDLDLGICFGREPWPGLVSHHLMADEPVPVCSPALVEAGPRLRAPEDLRRATLIHVLPRAARWASWLAAAGVGGVDPERGPMFPNTTLALEAAESGLGVALASRALAAPHLDAGTLVVPFAIDLRAEGGIYLLYPPAHAHVPAVAAFRDWLLAEVERESARGLQAPSWPDDARHGV